MRPARLTLARLAERSLAGISRASSASTVSAASVAASGGGSPTTGRTRTLPQASSPVSMPVPAQVCVLFPAGLKGCGRSPQAASAAQTSAIGETQPHGPDTVSTQLATSPTKRSAPKMMT